MLLVTCNLKDCVYWNSPLEKTNLENACRCAHPDKSMYINKPTCPLYKKGWEGNKAKELADRFRKKIL
jgi:hypothetical protein